ncbi:MAG: hypothetical protein AAF557_21770, partial [Pseudomonadota bacterium]
VDQTSLHSADVRLPLGEGLNEELSGNPIDFPGLDLVMVSYLLTETRGNWKDFFGDFLEKLKPGTLLLISEPTAWQLHSFLQRYEEHIASHQWLDSSQGVCGFAHLIHSQLQTHSIAISKLYAPNHFSQISAVNYFKFYNQWANRFVLIAAT